MNDEILVAAMFCAMVATPELKNESSLAASAPGDAEETGASGVDLARAQRQRYLLGRLVVLAWRHWPQCLVLVLLQAVLLLLGLVSLGGAGLAIDYLRSLLEPGAAAPPWPFGWSPPGGWPPMRTLWLIGGWILAASALRGALSFANTSLANWLGQARIVVELRAQVFRRMQQLGFRFFDANATGSLINRVTGDTQSVRLFIDGVAMQSLNVLLATSVYLTFLLRIHAGLAIACLSVMPVLAVIVVVYARLLRPEYEAGRERVDTLVRIFEELVRGIGVVKSFGIEPWAERRFLEANAGVRDQKRRVFQRLSTLTPTVSLLNQVSMVILLGYGGWLAIHDRIAIGSGLIVFAGILQQLAAQVNAVGSIADNLQQTLTAADRVYEILDAEPEIADRPDAAPLERTRGHVRFDQVSFRFTPANTVLHEIDLDVAPGEKIAIVGATGSGKSALIHLIPRFYDPDAGRILLDGRDLREWRLADVRRQVGLVFQESFLFRASVAANIAFGNPEATDEQIERAARLAVAHEFIELLPQGYETLLHENGSNLSGGQRQRLALARAILLDPGILVLDDPTAAVDAETEEEILDAMESVSRGRTTFIVAHRFSTVRRADRIAVLEAGRLVAMGTHAELRDWPGYYRDAVLAEKGGSE
ncbi:MAG: ABC transporter ATP-binding protein [Verrucomicrobiae bacterium]|nr:ABC transporter ATP-binding protein [Verrucomicrobiae bacterium]